MCCKISIQLVKQLRHRLTAVVPQRECSATARRSATNVPQFMMPAAELQSRFGWYIHRLLANRVAAWPGGMEAIPPHVAGCGAMRAGAHTRSVATTGSQLRLAPQSQLLGFYVVVYVAPREHVQHSAPSVQQLLSHRLGFASLGRVPLLVRLRVIVSILD